MRLRKCAVLCAILVVLCSIRPVGTESGQVIEPSVPNPGPEFRELTRAVMGLLSKHGAPTMWIKEELGAQALKHYLDGWDPGGKLLIWRDLEAVMQRRHTISDELRKGQIGLPFSLFRVVKTRQQMRVAHSLRLLRQGFDFERDEVLTTGRRDTEWTLDDTDLEERWRKCVKNDVIELRLAGRTPAEIIEVLEHRYLMERDRLKQVDVDDIVDRWLNAYVRTVDRHGAYLSPRLFDSMEIQGKGFLEGIGVVLASRDQYPVIERVIPGSPAAQSDKVHVGDRIVGIKNRRDARFSDILGWPIREVAKKLRGPRKSVVELHILSAGPQATLRKVRLVRNRIMLQGRTATARLIETGGPGQIRKVGVIEIPTFHVRAGGGRGKLNEGTSRHVRQLIGTLRARGMEGLVLDLRRNSGGAILEAARTAGLFVGGGPMMQIRLHTGKVHVYEDPDPKTEWRGALSVLVGPKSASAAEIVAAVIQDYRRGIVIGEKTYGKGTVQKIIRLDDVRKGAALKITSSRWYRVTGESVEGRGVYPDVDLTGAMGSEHAELTRPHNGKERAIGATRWEPYHVRKGHIAVARARSRERMEKNPALQALREDTNEPIQSPTARSVSLHLERRWAEHFGRERRRRNRIKTLREALSHDQELRNVKELSQFRKALFLREAIQITLDLENGR